MSVLAYVGRNNGGNTQVVYSIFFMTDVEDATIISVALRVLAMEKDDIQIGDQQYPLVGNTGIFKALNETQTDNDGEWTPAVVTDIISLQQYGRAAMHYRTCWESSNTGDTGRAAILEILGDQHCRLMKILGEQQCWRY